MSLTTHDNSWLATATITEIEQHIYDIREVINTRDDVADIITMLSNNDITLDEDPVDGALKFCKRKAPQSQQ